MKFTLLNGILQPDGVMDKINRFSDKVIDKEKGMLEAAAHPVWTWVKEQLIDLGNWVVANIPDIMGYGAILAAVCVILGAAAGKGKYLKPLVMYGIAFIIAIVVRGGAHGS
jgi:hypothetical protein